MGILSIVTGLSVESAFALFNVCISIATAFLFEHYLRRTFHLTRLSATLGGCLFIASASNVGTVAFPMLEPASAFFSCLIFLTASNRRTLGFACTSVAAVATKEILVFSSLLWWLHREPSERAWRCIAVSSLPLLAFASIRIVMGSSALEVNYGFDILHGEFPAYGRRLLGFNSCLAVMFQTFLSFSFFWFGLLRAHRHPQLRRELILVPLVIIAAALLSGRITRVLGVLFPIVLPAFLVMLEEMAASQSGTQLAPPAGGTTESGTSQ